MKKAKRKLKSVFARKRRKFVKAVKRIKLFKMKKENEKRFQREMEKRF